MSFETTYGSIRTLKRENVGSGQFVQECSLEASEDIIRVLSLTTRALIENISVVGGEIVVVGKALTNMLYSGETGINTANASCPFSYKFALGTIDPESKFIGCVQVLESAIDGISGTVAKANITLEVSVVAYSNGETRTLMSAGEGVCQKDINITSSQLVAYGTNAFAPQVDFVINGAIKKILTIESDFITKDIVAGYNFAVFDGELFTRVCYCTEAEPEKFIIVTNTLPIKQEIEMDGVTKDMRIEGCAGVVYDKVVATITESGVSITSPINFTAVAFENITALCLGDLYSCDHEITITTESYAYGEMVGIQSLEGKIEGSTSLSEDQPRVDKMLGYPSTFVCKSNAYVDEEGEIVIDGVARTSVIYLNDELGSISSTEIEVPFSISERCEYAKDSELSVQVVLTDVDVMVKKGRDIYFDGKVKAFVSYSRNNTGAVISNASEGDAFEEQDVPITMYFAESGSKIWDIAKSLKVDEKILLDQNPDLTDPLDKNEKIIIYKQKVN